MSRLPLEGMRVVDFTQIQAGPQCTLWLRVMGAEVIKVESRKRPDLLRLYTQTRYGGPDVGLNRSPAFSALNLGKKGCTLNLTQPRARELVKDIVRLSDVVVENFSTGVMDRLGLDYSSLKEIKPDIIMLSISGLGRTGPEKSYLAYAAIIHAFSGLCSLSGYPGGEPNLMGAMWSDVLGAQTGAFAVLAALHHRTRTGQGQYIDLAMSEATLSVMPEAIMDYTMNRRVRGCEGNRDDIMAPHGCYPCQGEDKWVAIAIADDEEWRAFCQAIDSPAWTEEQRFADQLSRWQNQQELDRLVAQWTRNHSHSQVMRKLQEAGIAAGPSCNVTDVLRDPHLRERGFFLEVEHPEMGKATLARTPWYVDGEAVGTYEPAPMIGEYNEYVFRTLLGMSQEEVSRLVEEKVIY
ncbi:CaiB/BaiF CoA transferase family protein [Thermodesulfobacteriota bacterium]